MINTDTSGVARNIGNSDPVSKPAAIGLRNLNESLYSLYENWAGVPPVYAVRILGAGSDRVYWRLGDDSRSAIGVVADNIAEANCFVALARCFRNHGVNVPEVYGEALDGEDCVYLLEDLGDTDLFSILHTPEGESLLPPTLQSLILLQTLPSEEWENLVAYPPLSRRQVMWDLNYFKYEYLKPAAIDFSEDKLEDEFEAIADALLSIPESRVGFMMRDCQSRNVMVKDSTPFWIDFQGGRRGPALYDAVSFIYQARAGFSPALREELMSVYADSFCSLRGISKEDFLSDLPLMRLFRGLQVMGAYGFRGLVQHRAHFVVSIPKALENLSQLSREGAVDMFPELKRIIGVLSEDHRFSTSGFNGLEVKVFSFSYKKGYPDDFSGNGGGFMFDCRSLPNPGRYVEYKELTGLDQPVVDFFSRYPEISTFIGKVESIVGPAVERYLERGFTSLQIGFGCTGGQHRSVFSAETVGEWLASEFPDARISVCHRERGIKNIKSEGRNYKK